MVESKRGQGPVYCSLPGFSPKLKKIKKSRVYSFFTMLTLSLILAFTAGFSFLWDYLQTLGIREGFHRAVIRGKQLPSQVKLLDDENKEVLRAWQAEVIDSWLLMVQKFDDDGDVRNLVWARANLRLACSSERLKIAQAESELENQHRH